MSRQPNQQVREKTSSGKEVFDYLTLRALIGIIALALPFAVSLVARLSDGKILPSISASYYSSGRDLFVGMLFIVGSFLLAYKGHRPRQNLISNLAAISAYGVALAPTACETCSRSPVSTIHYISAGVLFLCLAYFCLVPFRDNRLGSGVKKELRNRIYLACGVIMLACIVSMILANLLLAPETMASLRIVYWGETIALLAFGLAWFVSGKTLLLYTDPQDLHTLGQ